MKRILIIQTAFIGDVVLATPIIEQLHAFYPGAMIDFMLRKGNESLLEGHPYVNKLIIWDKKNNKYRNYFRIIRQIRKLKYNLVINVQRFASTGLMTAFSAADIKIGFDKNPFAFLFDKRVNHIIDSNIHEIDRNLSLIQDITQSGISEFPNYQIPKLIKLYPSTEDFNFVKQYKNISYICIAPASVWFTKQFPENKWIELINKISTDFNIILLGGKSDIDLCNDIIEKHKILTSKPETLKLKLETKIYNLAGKLSFLQTAALMKDAKMNYVNDSAPMHIASSVNAHVTAVYCSTVPEFGFGPLSDKSFIVQTMEDLDCRPCGLHGFAKCPQNHFNCANNIKIEQLLFTINI